ncbi:hypothetical protein [Aliiroseovarius halocynthiae]|uniref:Uncharacterized protein n=1 Tax=Aliiroseovarius halocynthiae TaxID=985055 RepID=A0A545SL40_9RHOB|nr:hypothetical protein [Aliiroseovarius halocynthiae]TQV65672.1 hypothetical protein FIL88_16340 [Aliiroseovarius halocynthiae]
MTDPTVFEQTPWKTLDPAVLEQAKKVPTMLAPEEQQFYAWATSEWMQGDGAVVDLGCFAGGSTARLAAGHQRAGHPGLIHAYDRFHASELTKNQILYAQGIAPFDGEEILDLTIDLLTPWTERIALYPGNIEDQVWEDGAIEVLAMDASKTIPTMDQMAHMFFPSLIPRRSLVIQQDYLFWRLPWIPIQMELLADYFTPVACVQKHTVVFLNTEKLDADALETLRVSALAPEDRITTLIRARERLEEAGFPVSKRMTRQIAVLQKHPNASRATHFPSPQ